ncbi:Wzz/FepE/Etk N-terminal domain-containing protein [Kitasatospora sp. NBC_01287]|uniref:Wzz/FepE/Etk N-terminal domain-containing protein n=1 Tax=Kitasatospora sp. NBC_01287 TaxID=2903573 RepID=UPI00225B8AA2|nr:Wzz/FepE/Etk N-terminal domain-containing protein [Kitasatospora sp. NBC_01287]MCX4746097.1 Wzz/FepE/Etk N-terminal domain-containing protein [Kitasatospora sp. NBC_01287]
MSGIERGQAARVRTLARRWWPLAVAVPLGAVAGAGYAVVAPPVYTANSYVVVVPDPGGEAGLAVNFAQAYGRLAAQPQVLELAAPEAGRSGAELAGLVAGTTSPDAPVIEIAGSGGHPQDAVKAADAVAKALISFANTSSKETGVKLVPLAAAAEPDQPTTPSGRLDVAVGGAAGVLVGALAMMARRKAGDPAAAVPGGAAPVEPAAVVPTPTRAAPDKRAEPAGSAK